MASLDDAARKWTDKELKSLEWRMKREYQQAAKEMRGKQAKWLEKFEREREQREKALDDTKEAMERHERWLQSQAARADWMGNMADQLAQSAHQANVRAIDMVNDHIPKVYAENANRAAYSVDKMLKADTSFTLVNEDAVRYLMGIRTEGADPTQLIRETPWFMPQEGREHLQDVRKREINEAMDIRWNRQKFTSAITQGILQGESIPNIVRRTREIYGQNMNAAIRAARTATTNAENAGRMNSFERAQKLGIDMEIEWLATLDGRTRSSHRELDGERIHTGEKFSNGLRWPGDPEGPSSEVWNCRCRANGRVVGFDGKRGDWADEVGERWARLPKGMTYEQWKAAKPVSRAESYMNDWGRVSAQWLGNLAAEAVSAPQANGFAGVVEGQDILGTWQRRPEQYEFEIEDVMAAQGFDGKPRIMDAGEFDNAVKQANGGDGLVMQRTYSAPDQATLDSYRDQLYSGKWYVDCSVNGSTYGRGMYATPDWHGVESEGLRQAADFYSRFNASSGLSYSNTEIMTLDRSARIVDYSDVKRKFDAYRAGVETASAGASQELREKASESFLKSLIRSTDIEPDKYDDALYFLKANTGRVQGDWDRMSKAANSLGGDGRQAVIELQQRAAMEEHDFVEKYISEHIGGGGVEDVGSYAASLGYDAIRADQGVGGGEIVVLNRTKLIIRRPE